MYRLSTHHPGWRSEAQFARPVGKQVLRRHTAKHQLGNERCEHLMKRETVNQMLFQARAHTGRMKHEVIGRIEIEAGKCCIGIVDGGIKVEQLLIAAMLLDLDPTVDNANTTFAGGIKVEQHGGDQQLLDKLG